MVSNPPESFGVLQKINKFSRWNRWTMNDWHWTKKNHQHLRARSPSLKRCLTIRTFVNSRYTLFQVLNCSKYEVGAAQKWWWWRSCEDNAKDRTWLPGSRAVACASSPTASHRTTPRPSLPSWGLVRPSYLPSRGVLPSYLGANWAIWYQSSKPPKRPHAAHPFHLAKIPRKNRRTQSQSSYLEPNPATSELSDSYISVPSNTI